MTTSWGKIEPNLNDCVNFIVSEGIPIRLYTYINSAKRYLRFRRRIGYRDIGIFPDIEKDYPSCIFTLRKGEGEFISSYILWTRGSQDKARLENLHLIEGGSNDPSNEAVNFMYSGGYTFNLAFRLGRIGIDRVGDEYRYLGVAGTPTPLIFNFEMDNISSTVTNTLDIISYRRWLGDALVKFAVTSRFRGRTYEDIIREYCKNNMRFSDCTNQEICPANSENADCRQGYINTCFNPNSPYNINNTSECSRFCGTRENKGLCNNEFKLPTTRFCKNTDFDDMFKKDRFCYGFYEKSVYNCNAMTGVDKDICETAVSKYEHLCDLPENQNKPECICISPKGLANNRKKYFDDQEDKTRNTIIREIDNIIKNGKVENRDLTQDEIRRLETFKTQVAIAIKDQFDKYRSDLQGVPTVCFVDECRASENRNKVIKPCLLTNLIIASCFNTLNIGALLGGVIRGTIVNQTCNITVGTKCENGKCPNGFTCEKDFCVLSQTNKTCDLDETICTKIGQRCDKERKICVPFDITCEKDETICTRINQRCDKDKKICVPIEDSCQKPIDCDENYICNVNNKCEPCGFFQDVANNKCETNLWKLSIPIIISIVVFIFILIFLIIIISVIRRYKQ
jgi:hypothetical protein